MRSIPIAIALVAGLSTVALAQGWNELPPYPRATELCHQRVYGKSMEIHWTAYTTSDTPEAVVAFYEKKLGKGEKNEDEVRFRVSGGGKVNRVLSVHPVKGRYPRCGKEPRSSDRTVVIASRAHHRGP